MKKLETQEEISQYDSRQISAFIERVSPENLQEKAFELSQSQIETAMAILRELPKTSSTPKLCSLIQGVLELKALEGIGHTVNLDQLSTLLDYVSSHHEIAWKLFPIFVAVPQTVFTEMLEGLTEAQKVELEALCSTEPLQHHLFMFIHRLKVDEENLMEHYTHLKGDILQVDGLTLTPNDLAEIKNDISHFTQKIQSVCSKIENALALAWKAGRSDLIEALSSFRERYERLLLEEVGKIGEEAHRSTGLYQLLESELKGVFANKEEGDALDDEAPAIEALARLSLWYVKDYWDVGLLPEISDPTQIALPLLGGNSDRLAKYQKDVEAKLEKLGLRTVKDLKDRLLVSKALLQDYVNAFKSKA